MTLPFVSALAVLALANVRAVPHLSAEIEIDGRLTEPAWQHALQVELPFQTRPGENTAAPVSTTAFLVDTGNALAVAFRAHDPDPQSIRAFLHDRDAAYSDDFVGVVLDTFNDERRALEFFANPHGAQMDLIQDDVNGNEDDSWDAIWHAAGVIGDAGYVVEMEIPYAVMPLPDGEGERTFGIDLLRFYPREERYRLSNNRQDRSVSCYLCQLEKFSGFEHASPGRDLEITPTLTATAGEFREDILDDDLQSADAQFEPGLDISWGITPNINLSATLNPDFSQVEADVAQLAVNQTFALFFPEKRPFFLEGADYFQTPINAVYTRNVSDPNVGARVTGKIGRNLFGFFTADDEVTNFLIPGAFGSDLASLDRNSRAAVLRYRRDVGENSSLGLLATRRDGDDDYGNRTIGFDGRLRFSDSDTLTWQYLDSQTDYPGDVQEDFDQPASLSGDALNVRYNHSERDWNSYLTYNDYDDGFRADLGFIGQVDYRRAIIGGGYNWWGEEDDWYTRLRVSGDWDLTHDQSGRLLEREYETYLSYQGEMQSYLELGLLSRDRRWDGVLFDERHIGIFGEFQPRSGLYLNLYLRYGDEVDFANSALGRVRQVQPRVRLNLGQHWRFELRHTYRNLRRDGGDVFDANQSDLRIAYQFDLRQRLRLTVQYTDLDRDARLYGEEIDEKVRDLGTQLIYSYKVNPRTVIFAGYSDRGLQTDAVDDLVTTNRTLFIKLGYAWTPG